MSFFNKIKNDIKFVEGLVKSKNLNEVKDKIKQQHEEDKKFINEVGTTIKTKLENDIVFVKKMTKVETITDVVENIKEQRESDKEFVKDMTGLDINKIEEDVVNTITEPITNEYERLRRAFIVFNILLYLFDTKLFFIFWISYIVYKYF